MASFDEHVEQANSNLKFLEAVNSSIEGSVDWQITVCFYVAVHIVNAHIAKCEDKHYRAHTAVDASLNPFGRSSSKVSEDCYAAYTSLWGLSRRARYLVHEKKKGSEECAFPSYERHLAKALRHLNTIYAYFEAKHSISFEKIVLANPPASDQWNFLAVRRSSAAT